MDPFDPNNVIPEDAILTGVFLRRKQITIRTGTRAQLTALSRSLPAMLVHPFLDAEKALKVARKQLANRGEGWSLVETPVPATTQEGDVQ